MLRERIRRLLGACRPHSLLVRRILAGALTLLAAGLALVPSAKHGLAAAEPTVQVVVTVRDLAPGTVLSTGDVALHGLPHALVPSGALTTTGAAIGQVLTSAARTGEAITDARLLGPPQARMATGDPDTVSVAVRLADPAVAELLHPGSRVDVVTAGDGQTAPGVPATDATVLMVRTGALKPGEQGQLVVLAIRKDRATGVAAAALHDPVAVTLR